MKLKSTIYHIKSKNGRNHYFCCTKKHGWMDEESAVKCCNGWTAVRIPAYYSSGLREDWGKWYLPEYPSHQGLIPDFLTDEIDRLRAIAASRGITVWDWDLSNIESEN